jgi:chemotaxis protein methyltransferase CheR
MRDEDCVALLAWLLPRLGLRWAGFRAVRKQVCKRISRRLAELHLSDGREYRSYLESHPEEWAVADSFCTVTISSFNRDSEVFAFLGRVVLPELATRLTARGESELRAWSAGCASGEEAYTLALVWHFLVAASYPDVSLQVVGTDIDPHLLKRAEAACYTAGAVKHVPRAWLADAFDEEHGVYRLKAPYKAEIGFGLHDLRQGAVGGSFHLITCRNVAFTYFGLEQQSAAAMTLHGSLCDGGALVLGREEKLPPGTIGFSTWSDRHAVYRRGLEARGTGDYPRGIGSSSSFSNSVSQRSKPWVSMHSTV